jgi:four helix bundle protein
MDHKPPWSIVYGPSSTVQCTNSKTSKWHLSLDYLDLMYQIAADLPRHEQYNLKQQLQRAATSIALNIAEGSTGQTDAEQSRFLAMALRSLIETVACQQIIRRRRYLPEPDLLDDGYTKSQTLAKKLQAFRNSLSPGHSRIREDQAE